MRGQLAVVSPHFTLLDWIHGRSCSTVPMLSKIFGVGESTNHSVARYIPLLVSNATIAYITCKKIKSDIAYITSRRENPSTVLFILFYTGL